MENIALIFFVDPMFTVRLPLNYYWVFGHLRDYAILLFVFYMVRQYEYSDASYLWKPLNVNDAVILRQNYSHLHNTASLANLKTAKKENIGIYGS